MYENVFRPLTIGSVEVSNRVCRTAHGVNPTPLRPDDDPWDARIEYYAARARGGFGLAITGIQGVHPSSTTPRFKNAYDPGTVPAYQKMADAVHEYGMKIFQQL